jgi:hypothetical protein
MGAKFEAWRAADQTAYQAEMQIHNRGRRHGHMPSLEELERIRELRRVADQLFNEAMRELSQEVGAAMRGGLSEFRRSR